MPPILSGEFRMGADRGRGDKTIGHASLPTARCVKELGCFLGFQAPQGDHATFDQHSHLLNMRGIDRSIKKFRPSHRAGGEGLSLPQPADQCSFHGQMTVGHTDQKICIQMNHRRLRPQARRSRKTSAFHLAAALAEIPLCRNHSSASNGVRAFGFSLSKGPIWSTARRMTSDFATPQAVANSCTRSTVSGLRE